MVVTDNLVAGTYGTKFTPPAGIDAGKLGRRTGRITLKADATALTESVFGQLHNVNPEQPYLESYGR